MGGVEAPDILAIVTAAWAAAATAAAVEGRKAGALTSRVGDAGRDLEALCARRGWHIMSRLAWRLQKREQKRELFCPKTSGMLTERS